MKKDKLRREIDKIIDPYPYSKRYPSDGKCEYCGEFYSKLATHVRAKHPDKYVSRTDLMMELIENYVESLFEKKGK